jgi:hypothetical protein
MDRDKCKLLSAAALAALEGVERQFGVKAAYRGGSYGTGNCRLRFEFAEITKDGMAQTAAAEAWQLAVMHGLPKDGLGKVFEFRGKQYKVTGYKPGCKFNIVADRVSDGKGFKFQSSAAFKACPPAPSQFRKRDLSAWGL